MLKDKVAFIKSLKVCENTFRFKKYILYMHKVKNTILNAYKF